MNALLKAQELENDLRTLCVEFGKVFPDVKQAAERAIVRLRAVQDQKSSQQALEVLHSELAYRPFLLACAAKSPKLTVLSLNALQKLLSMDISSAEILSSVIGTLRIQAESDDESVQVKILQTLLLAVGAPSAMSFIEENALSQALGLCFRLHGGAGRSPLITNTATATLRQILTVLFDRVNVAEEVSAYRIAESSQLPELPMTPSKVLRVRPAVSAARQQQLMSEAAEPRSPAPEQQAALQQLSRTARCCWLLLHDLCLLCSGEHSFHESLWLKLSAQLPVPVALELVESLLSQNILLFLHVPPFSALLRSQVCPLVIKLMSERGMSSSLSFPMMLRALRLMVVLVRHYYTLLAPDCEIFMSMLMRQLEHETSLSQRVLALEAVKLFTASPDLLYFFYRLLEESPESSKVFGSLCHALSRVVLQAQSKTGLDEVALVHALWSHTSASSAQASAAVPSISAGTMSAAYVLSSVGNLLSSKQVAVRGRGLDLLGEREAPNFDELLPVALAIDSLRNIVHSLQTLVTKCPLEQLMALQFNDNGLAASVQSAITVAVEPASPTSRRSSLGELAASNGRRLSDPTYNISGRNTPIKLDMDEWLDLAHVDAVCVSGMAAVASVPLLTTLTQSLQHASLENQIQHILTMFQSFSNSCGRLSLVSARDAFLATLCRFALPDRSVTGEWMPVNTKCSQSAKSLFNIAHGLGAHLGSAWTMILECFCKLNALILSQGRRHAPGSDDDIGLLSTALSRLFDSSAQLDDVALHHMLMALGTIALSSVADLATSEDDVSVGARIDHSIWDGSVPSARTVRRSGASNSTANSAATAVRLSPAFSSAENTASVPANSATQHLSLRDLRSYAALTWLPDLFALLQLLRTIELNVARRPWLWTVAVGHLQVVAQHRAPLLRAFGVEALATLGATALQILDPVTITQAMFESSIHRDSEFVQLLPSPSSPTNEQIEREPFCVQRRILQPFLELVKSKHDDTRHHLIAVVNVMIHSCAPSLRGGWHSIFALLSAVANTSSDSTLITVAFQCVQLVHNDFLDILPGYCLFSWANCLSCFGAQRVETNISFSAIGLIRDLVDYAIRRHEADQTYLCLPSGQYFPLSNELLKSELGFESVAEFWTAVAASPFPQFLLLVSTHLRILCSDVRADVRNSALQTLLSALATHGQALDTSAEVRGTKAWSQAWTVVLYPLVRLLFDSPVPSGGSESGTDAALGRERATGRSVMMLAHHSRSTAAQQWDESRVHFLQGFARLFRQHLVSLCSNTATLRAPPAWQCMLAIVSQCVAVSAEVGAPSRELVTAGIAAFVDILSAPRTLTVIESDPSVWSESVQLISSWTESLEASHNAVLSVELCSALVSGIRQLLQRARQLFSSNDLRVVFGLCDRLCWTHAHTLATSATRARTRISNLQRAQLQLIEDFPSFGAVPDSMWSYLLEMVLKYVRCGLNETDAPFLPHFAERAVQLLPRLFGVPSSTSNDADSAVAVPPPAVRALHVEAAVSLLSHLLRMSSLPRSSTLFLAAIGSLCSLLSTSLPALDEASAADKRASQVWTALCDLWSVLIQPSDVASPVASQDYEIDPQVTSAEKFRVDMLNCLCVTILPNSRLAPASVQRRLLALLYSDDNVSSNVITSTALGNASLRGLFHLCAAPSTESHSAQAFLLKLAQLALPLLLVRCTEVLRRYAEFIRSSDASDPNASSNRVEVVMILRNVLSCPLHPQIFTSSATATSADSMKRAGIELQNQQRGLIVKLMPIMCDLISTRDEQICDLLRSIFLLVASSLDSE